MKLPTEFYKLPLRFDVERLVEEVSAFGEEEWRPHPQGFPGNTALILISANGSENDELNGPMQPTSKLGRCPYIRQILAGFNSVIGRSRLMRLAPQSEVSEHSDIHLYWHDRVRVHIPIITDPAIRFFCNGRDVHMAPGEAWTFDNWKQHKVMNPIDVTRIHLVFDTTGSASFWELVKCAETPFDAEHGISIEPRFLGFDPGAPSPLATERYNAPVVVPPGEMDRLLAELADDASTDADTDRVRLQAFLELLLTFRREWRTLWSQYGEGESGWTHYQSLIEQTVEQAKHIPGELKVASNGLGAVKILSSHLDSALNIASLVNMKFAANHSSRTITGASSGIFDRPVFIVAAPRSGSTLLFETLANNREFWTLGGEGHREIENIPELNPAFQNYHSNRLTETDATPETASALRLVYMQKLRTNNNVHYQVLPEATRPASLRFLEKTPKNALRIPFLNAVFPDALFIFLYRNPRDNISSIIDAWHSGKFVTYPKLPGWEGLPWSLLLPPGWRELNGAAVEKIAAFQWKNTNLQILDDLDELPTDRWCAIAYRDFLSAPEKQLRRLCDFTGVPFGKRMQATGTDKLPLSQHTLTPPDPEKWRKNENELKIVLDQEILKITAQLNALVA